MNASEINQAQMIEISNLRFKVADLRATLEYERNSRADAISDAVKQEREASRKDIESLVNVAFNAVGYVAAANYPERHREALDKIDAEVNRIYAAIRARSEAKA